MKKIILILFLFLLLYSCYFIYNITETDKIYYTSIGDSISIIKDSDKLENIDEYNTIFTNKDYRIVDLLNIIKYNEEIEIEDNTVSIHQILKKSDVIILSIGMNDIYSKLNDNIKEIYTYINNMINNLEKILSEIDRYDHTQVFVLGYYNITNKHDDIYTYLNYKLKRITNKYEYQFVDLNETFNKDPIYFEKNDNYYLNNKGYDKIMQLIVAKLKNN